MKLETRLKKELKERWKVERLTDNITHKNQVLNKDDIDINYFEDSKEVIVEYSFDGKRWATLSSFPIGEFLVGEEVSNYLVKAIVECAINESSKFIKEMDNLIEKTTSHYITKEVIQALEYLKSSKANPKDIELEFSEDEYIEALGMSGFFSDNKNKIKLSEYVSTRTKEYKDFIMNRTREMFEDFNKEELLYKIKNGIMDLEKTFKKESKNGGIKNFFKNFKN